MKKRMKAHPKKPGTYDDDIFSNTYSMYRVALIYYCTCTYMQLPKIEWMYDIYLVCGNTMCVSICQIDFVLLRTCLALYSTTANQIFRS